MIQLKNSTLTLDILEPGVHYTGSRFDWSGIIQQITYQGITCCVPEQLEPGKGSGGVGFCNEFGIDKPIGYEDAPVGAAFPKIGVGQLTKTSSHPYDFFAPYVVTPEVHQSIRHSDTSYQVISTLDTDTGYAYTLDKTIHLLEDSIHLGYRITNMGVKAVVTNAYNHNFIGFNQSPLDANYVLQVPRAASLEKTTGLAKIQGQMVTFPTTPDGDVYILVHPNDTPTAYNWDLKHLSLGIGIRECSIFPIAKMAIWGYTHVLCPEVFIDINLMPGEHLSFERIYQFYQF